MQFFVINSIKHIERCVFKQPTEVMCDCVSM